MRTCLWDREADATTEGYSSDVRTHRMLPHQDRSFEVVQTPLWLDAKKSAAAVLQHPNNCWDKDGFEASDAAERSEQ